MIVCNSVPFDNNGNMRLRNDKTIATVMKDVMPFRAKLKISDFGSSCGDYGWTGLYLRDTETDVRYIISLADFISIAKHRTIVNGVIDGTWKFCRRGPNYGIYHVGYETKGLLYE